MTEKGGVTSVKWQHTRCAQQFTCWIVLFYISAWDLQVTPGCKFAVGVNFFIWVKALALKMWHRKFLLDANLLLCKAADSWGVLYPWKMWCCWQQSVKLAVLTLGAVVLLVSCGGSEEWILPLPCWQTAGIILVVNAANYLFLLRMRYGKKGGGAVQRQWHLEE